MNELASTIRRKDIQGLRAIAVLLVVAYHAGLPATGGFFGVDVFFVISGFVITASLKKEFESTGTIRFRSFYFARFKRLAPNLSLMIFVAMVVSTLLLTPLDQKKLTAMTGLGAIFSLSNLVLIFNSKNYFAPDVQSNLLLHTWSLSVEDQIYFVYPIFIFWIYRLASKPRVDFTQAIIAATALASYLMYVLGDPSRPVLFGSFSPIVRIWAFLIGSMLANGRTNGNPYKLSFARLSNYLGLLFILTPAFIISSENQNYKTISALPVLGTVLIIKNSHCATSLFRKLISNRLFTKIGDASYAIYLWHWPIIVIARETFTSEVLVLSIAATFSFLPALMSFHLVESPLKSHIFEGLRKKSYFIILALAIPLFSLVAVFQLSPSYFNPRISFGHLGETYSGDIGQENFSETLSNYGQCNSRNGAYSANEIVSFEKILSACKISKSITSRNLALVGSSHIEQLLPGFAESLPDTGVMYFARATADGYIEKIKTVLLANENVYGVVLEDTIFDLQTREQIIQFVGSLLANEKKVFVVEGMPSFNFDPIKCKYKNFITQKSRCDELVKANLTEVDQKRSSDLEALNMKFHSVRIIRLSNYLCKDEYCSMRSGNLILYRDPSHLNLIGSSIIVGKILNEFPDLG